MNSPHDLERRLTGMSAFDELLRIAGFAAANAASSTHRAIAIREVDAAARELPPDLPTAKAALAEALIGAVHALAAAPSLEIRTPIARALRELVVAGRTPITSRQPQHRRSEPRRYWIEP